MLWTPSASTKPSYCANNFVRHGLLQNHVLSVRWVLFQAVPFLFFIAIWRFVFFHIWRITAATPFFSPVTYFEYAPVYVDRLFLVLPLQEWGGVYPKLDVPPLSLSGFSPTTQIGAILYKIIRRSWGRQSALA